MSFGRARKHSKGAARRSPADVPLSALSIPRGMESEPLMEGDPVSFLQGARAQAISTRCPEFSGQWPGGIVPLLL